MGKLLPEAEGSAQRSYRFEEADGRDAEFPNHAGRYATTARHASTVCRCSAGYASYGRGWGLSARNATDDGTDDGPGHGCHVDGSGSLHADDASGCSWCSGSQPEFWRARVW